MFLDLLGERTIILVKYLFQHAYKLHYLIFLPRLRKSLIDLIHANQALQAVTIYLQLPYSDTCCCCESGLESYFPAQECKVK